MRLYELFRSTGFHLCAYLTADGLKDAHTRVMDLTREADRKLGQDCQRVVMLDEGLPAEVDVNADVVVDHKGRFAARVHVSNGDLLLVRPDGYLAFRTSEWQVLDVIGRIAEWITRKTA